MKYNLREMTINDVDDVVKAEEEVFGESLGSDLLYSELKINPFAYYFVLEIDGSFGGYIGLWIEEEHSEILNFLILEKYRNMGFGSMVLEFVIDLVASVNVNNISLEVRESNKTAQKLYEKYGFVYSHTRKNYYKNGEDALLLVKEIK